MNINRLSSYRVVNTSTTYKMQSVNGVYGQCSVVVIATGYGLDGPGVDSRWEARYSAPVQTGPGVHPASCTMGTGSFPRVNSGRGVTLTPHPLREPWSRKSTAINLLPLPDARPVQSLSACTRVTFTFTLMVYMGKYRSVCAEIRTERMILYSLYADCRNF
jgi:hypothetical protein